MKLITLALGTFIFIASACDGGSGGGSDHADTLPASDTVPADQLADDTALDIPAQPAWEFTAPAAPLSPAFLVVDLPAPVEGLVFDDAGRLFVSGTDSRVYGVNPDGTWSEHAALLPVEGATEDVAGMARDVAGNLYVCRYAAGRIERITPDDPPVVEVFAEGLDHPNSMAFAPDGTLWYTASGDGAGAPGHVGRIPANGEPQVLIDDVVYANGLAFSPDGLFVWFTSTDPGSLHRAPLDEDGLPGPTELVSDHEDLAVADGLAIAPDGTVFIAGFMRGKILAWAEDSLITVAEAPAPPGIAGVASLAFGRGEGFPETTLYATNLLQAQLIHVDLAP